MSLCNHVLSVVCRHWRCCHCHHCHLWTVLSTGLIIETSYLTHICTYAPSICAWISEYKLYFLNGSHFSSFLYVALLTTWFRLEPSSLAQLWTYTGAIHTEEIRHWWRISLELQFFKIFTFYFFPIHNLLWETNYNELLAHLAIMPKSLCNHELSIMGQHCCQPLSIYIVLCHCLKQSFLATGLITETSCLAHTCTYSPGICTWIIKSIQPVFFKQEPFS